MKKVIILADYVTEFVNCDLIMAVLESSAERMQTQAFIYTQ